MSADPALAERGIIEGFYGEPWTHAERLRMLAEAGSWGMNRYAYAPKDDPYHRARWRDPYPAADAALLAELAEAGRRAGVELVYALHPGLDMVHSADAEHAALAAKTRALHDLGIRRFALLFDDIAEGLAHDDDRARFGEGARGAGRAHGATCARYRDEVLAPLGLAETLLMVPTDYAGSGPTPYREGLDETLPADTAVLWTGDDIVVGEITAGQARRAAAAFGGRPLVIWDNFPVNDFDRSRAFLGPLLGRDPGLPGAGVRGILANPMVEYEPSRFALRTVALWAEDPTGYDPAAAAERALREIAGDEADDLRPLIAAASSWPPSAPQHPVLDRALDAAISDGGRMGVELESLLGQLHRLGSLEPRTPLSRTLGPWAHAAPRTAGVIEVALARIRGETGADAVAAAWEAARTARHGLARDAARRAAERAVGHALPDRVRPEGVPAAQQAGGD